MARIRSGDTAPEVKLRRKLHAGGFRYLLHDKRLPGRPDMVFPRYRAAVFVHGCFWHRHPKCRYATMPKTNKKFWREKLNRNVNRDTRQQTELSASGWRIAVIWECALKARDIDPLIRRVTKWIRSNRPKLECPTPGRRQNRKA